MNQQNESLHMGLKLGGVFHCEIVRNGAVIDEWDTPNLVVDEGINHILNVEFNSLAQVTQWYVGIYEGNYSPVAGVTAATIAAACTESTAYDEATRQGFTTVTTTTKSVTNNAAKAAFTINATKTIYGAFIVSSSAKSGTTGALFAAAKFATERLLQDNDVFLVSYTVNGAAA